MIEVEIKKPLQKNYCCIRDIYVEQAIELRQYLKVILPTHSAVIDPREWKKGKRMEKIFKKPDEPMILYCNYVPKENESVKNESKVKEEKQQQLFT